jgi:fumarylpyruvate hydrolase
MKTTGAELSAGATRFLFEPPLQPGVPVRGESALYPVHRIFCVGRNYVEHAKEMGVEPERETPWYFTKPATAVVLSGTTVPYPPGTQNYHYEMELVVAIGAAAYFVEPDQALNTVFGYATGLDMTRRDLQMAERAKSRPWDIGKSFEQSAIIASITKRAEFGNVGPQRITLEVNGETKQNALLSHMIWSVPEIISHLSRYYHLGAGDLIYSGTPAGVGPVKPGDRLIGKIDGLLPVELAVSEGDQPRRS